MTNEEFEELTLRIIAAADTQPPVDIHHLASLAASAAPYLAKQPAHEVLLFAANLVGSLEPTTVMYILGLVTTRIEIEAAVSDQGLAQ